MTFEGVGFSCPQQGSQTLLPAGPVSVNICVLGQGEGKNLSSGVLGVNGDDFPGGCSQLPPSCTAGCGFTCNLERTLPLHWSSAPASSHGA